MKAALLPLIAIAASAQPLKLPSFERQTLPNGAVVLMMPRRDVPLVSLRVLARGGDESDPAAASGLASVTAELLRRGTPTRTADQFSEQLDFLGASFGAFSGGIATSVSAECLSRYTDRVLDLVADAALRPTFPEAEFTKVIAQRVDGARSVKDNPQGAIGPYFRSFFFGAGHPYGRPADEKSLSAIRREHVLDHHRRAFCGRNLVIIAVGDFDTKTLGPLLAKTFGQAPEGAAAVLAKDPGPPSRASARLTLVDKPDSTQTYFQIGQPGIFRTHPDRIPLMLVNTHFGGRFTSMLNDELRVNSGLTYGANSQLQQSRLTGAIVISSYTQTDTTVQAMDLALDVLKRFGDKGLDAGQLDSVKAYVKGGFPTRTLETSDQLADVLADLELYGLGRDEIDEFFPRIDAVTLDQANALAKKFYRADNLQFCLIGAAAKIRAGVAKYAAARKELSINDPGFRVPE